MVQTRYYQEEAIVGLFNWFAANPTGNPLVALPTGTGKSIVIAEFIRRALSYYPQTRILVVTHRKELITQDHEELIGLWPTAPAGIYSAGLNRRDTRFPITFCGIASVASRVSDFGHVDLVIVDEAHLISHKSATMYQKAISDLRLINPFVRVIGLTATPYRLGLGMLTEGDIFTDISTNYCTYEKFNELMDAGYICPLIPKPTDTELSVEGVHIRDGEFVMEELQAAVDKEVLTRKIVNEAVAKGADRKHWLVFCSGTAHADHTCQYLNEIGIPAVSVHTNLASADVARVNLERKGMPAVGNTARDMHINAFKTGHARAMVGVDVFSTGFNFRPVDLILWMRPTLSPVFWVQGNGRGTRPSPETGKKNCLVLDFARNTPRLGPINDPVTPKKPGKKGSPMVPFKLCPACNSYNHTRARFCIDCNAEFPIAVNVTTRAGEQELIRREKPVKEPKPPKPPKLELPAVIETYEVERVEFSKHQSRGDGKPPSLKIHYYCGLRIFHEWLCLEHTGFACHKAREKWRTMAGYEDDPPSTVDEALTLTSTLHLPSRIRVMHGKFDEIVGYEFSTTQQPVLADEDRPF